MKKEEGIPDNWEPLYHRAVAIAWPLLPYAFFVAVIVNSIAALATRDHREEFLIFFGLGAAVAAWFVALNRSLFLKVYDDGEQLVFLSKEKRVDIPYSDIHALKYAGLWSRRYSTCFYSDRNGRRKKAHFYAHRTRATDQYIRDLRDRILDLREKK